MQIALVNTNRIEPPIAPIGLEYLAEVLNSEGYDVKILDLCWSEDSTSDISTFFNGTDFSLVGITMRNTDDCAFTNFQSFVNDVADIVNTVRNHTGALIVLGGVGFSTMPELLVERCKTDAGIWGDGEFSLVKLLQNIEKNKGWHDTPNIVWNNKGKWQRNPPDFPPLDNLPLMRRKWVDNPRYFLEGGQAGFETKRGCSGNCVYCAEPLAKGKKIRTRPPKAVADELESLVEQGIDHFHTCDSEFNMPEWHAIEVCKEITHRRLGDKLKWYAYCSPKPFSRELAQLMRHAGCVGINFGVDNGDDDMLHRLRRGFNGEDILNTASFCKEAGITIMFDLLLGSPGETARTLSKTIELMRKADPDRIGVSLGVRVYPGTELERTLTGEQSIKGLATAGDPEKPLFFLEPEIAPTVYNLLSELIGDDRRFLFFNPSNPNQNYNYNANQVLVDAIRDGYRGAFWDILRRVELKGAQG